MSVLAIIPARAGSKRIPNKNTKELCGKPLIEWTIETALTQDLIDHTVITSDNEDLRQYENGNISFLRRPDELCTDDATDQEVIKHVLQQYRLKFDTHWDLFVYLRPTTPFRLNHHLMIAIANMSNPKRGITDITGLRSVELMPESAYKCYTLNGALWLSPIGYPFSPESDLIDMTDWPNHRVPRTYKPNGYIDICRPEIIGKGQLWGNWIMGYVTPHTPEIDTPEDWQYAEWYGNELLQRQRIIDRST